VEWLHNVDNDLENFPQFHLCRLRQNNPLVCWCWSGRHKELNKKNYKPWKSINWNKRVYFFFD